MYPFQQIGIGLNRLKNNYCNIYKIICNKGVDSNQFGLSNCLTILSNDFGEVFFNLCKSFADKLKKATSLAEIIPEQNNKTTIAIASIITTFVSKLH